MGDKKITAIDIDDEALRRYRIKFADLDPTVILHDLNTPLGIPGGSQDIVVAGEILEHLVSPDRLIYEVWRVLKDGGIFVGSTPNALKWDKRLAIVNGRDPKEFSDETHLQYFSLNSLRKALQCKFPNVTIYPYTMGGLVSVLPSLRADGFVWNCVKK